MGQKVHVVINPASGQHQTILNKLNDVFHPAGVEWAVSITQKSGDAARFARQAIATFVCTRHGGTPQVPKHLLR